jgi:Spy/CpxP family protein refolding chaperone
MILNSTKLLVLFTAQIFMMFSMALAQPPGGPRPPKPEEQLKMATEKINKELKLNATQQQKVKAAYVDFFNEMDKMHQKNQPPHDGPPPPPTEAEQAARKKLEASRDAKVKDALFADQFKKYQELEKTMRPPKREGPPPGKPQQ